MTEIVEEQNHPGTSSKRPSSSNEERKRGQSASSVLSRHSSRIEQDMLTKHEQRQRAQSTYGRGRFSMPYELKNLPPSAGQYQLQFYERGGEFGANEKVPRSRGSSIYDDFQSIPSDLVAPERLRKIFAHDTTVMTLPKTFKIENTTSPDKNGHEKSKKSK